MNLSVFALYDQKAKAFLQPFFLPNEEVAKRAMTQHLQNPDTEISKFPSDYTLFQLGDYDDNTGEIKPEKTPVCSLVELIPPKPQVPEYNGEN